MTSDKEMMMTDLITYSQAIAMMTQTAKTLREANLPTEKVLQIISDLCDDLQKVRDELKDEEA